jgi:deoxyadenosine/deoxycytidine kinase
MAKLIVIRGPSASGKSTIAKKLHAHSVRPTLLIHEDEVRFMFSDWKQSNHTASKLLATSMIISGLQSSYDVIYEGISNIKTYDQYFQQIFKVHPHGNYFFYLNVSFEETLRRHKTRPQKDKFGIREMKRWLGYASPTGYSEEHIIPEPSTVEQTVEVICRVTGLDINNKD